MKQRSRIVNAYLSIWKTTLEEEGWSKEIPVVRKSYKTFGKRNCAQSIWIENKHITLICPKYHNKVQKQINKINNGKLPR